MSNKVKELIEIRVDALNDTIEWVESDLKYIRGNLEASENRIADATAERDELQAYVDEHFPTDVVLEQLQKTREVLAARGRTTRRFIDSDTCEVCLLGAAGIAVLGDEFVKYPSFYPFYDGADFDPEDQVYNPGAAREVARAINAELPAERQRSLVSSGLYEFNDAPTTTDEDVFDLIDRAIETRKAAA
ncbi:DUF6197 family protein [Mycobacteroides salmoniphilum]|uniref:DUF6197 family protein n=1 Tax=Mycobacteroides salmoniphilum TaxID=404941 RepID=UPI000991B768|nr:hypothetical protein [Mycobacteroides salmoniphilum]